LPFGAQPGVSFVYGYNTDILGCVVERASGMPLDRFIADRITGPLRMKDTHFFLPAAQRERLAAVYASGPGSKIVRAPDGARGQGHYVDGPRKNFAGGAGLLSTARDYARFLEAIRLGGALDGVRILEPSTVEQAFANQIGDLDFPPTIPTVHPELSAEINVGPKMKWGFGLLRNERTEPDMRAVGSGAWAGLFNTHFWVDPASGVTGALYTQSLPFAEPSVYGVYREFEQALYVSLSGRPA
jgi:CubicO group peptidase (beta-lactamase class C family)